MKFILSQLYDIRPITRSGRLDLSRIYRSGGVINLRDEDAVPAGPPMRRRQTARRLPAVPQIHGEAPPPFSSPAAVEDVSVPVSVVDREEDLEDWLLPARVAEHPDALTVDEVLAREIRGFDGKEEELEIPQERRVRGFVVAVVFIMLSIPAFAAVGSATSVQRAILAAAAEASDDIETAAAAIAVFDPDRAESAFRDAQVSFREAQERFSSLGYGALSFLAELPIPTRLVTGKALLDAGEHFAIAGEHVSRALRSTDIFSSRAVIGKLLASEGTPAEQGSRETSESFEEEFAEASAHLIAATEEIERVDPDAVPEPYREKVRRLRQSAPALRESVEALASSSRAVSSILGMEEPRRYLLLLQNASELRPTGGFIGNVAVIEVAGGAIRELRVEDAYLFDGQLTRYTVPPQPIQDISAAWSLHDSNWFRNFPDSARAASDFFEQTGSMTPHGVIAVTSRLVERLLAVTGPVETEDGLNVDAQSFVDTINAIGEQQRPGETIQAQAIGALLPALLDRLENAPPETVIDAMRAGIAGGDLQVWFRDGEEEGLVRRLGMAGDLPETEGDFLAVVSANINGFKTDRVLEESVAHEARIASDGSIADTVTLMRTHRGNDRREPSYRKVHKSYVRVFVPRGSELLAAEGMTCDSDNPPLDYASAGFAVHPLVAAVEQEHRRHPSFCVDVGEESGRTTFGAWLFVSPGESLTYRLTYRVPLRLAGPVDSYRLAIVKQPGAEPVFSSRVVSDVAWEPAWNDEAYVVRPDGAFATVPTPLLRNRLFGIVFTK